MSTPQYGPLTDEAQLTLDWTADTDHPSVAHEWDLFCRVLRAVAFQTGTVSPNDVRERIRGQIAPRRIGSFYRKARLAGLIAPAGWVVSDDNSKSGKNAGRPAMTYRWVGEAL